MKEYKRDMTLQQKQVAIEELCTLRFSQDFRGNETASAPSLEDNSEPGLLKGLCGRGETREAAVEDLFDLMHESTRIVKNARAPDRAHYLWHEASNKFIETSGP